MVPWNVADRTQCKIGPRVTPINSSTTKSGTRVKRDSRLAMYATTSRVPTIPNISVNCTMRISPAQPRKAAPRINGRKHHIRKSGDAIARKTVRTALHVLQFLSDSSISASDACNGSRIGGSRLESERIGGIIGAEGG